MPTPSWTRCPSSPDPALRQAAEQPLLRGGEDFGPAAALDLVHPVCRLGDRRPLADVPAPVREVEEGEADRYLRLNDQQNGEVALGLEACLRPAADRTTASQRAGDLRDIENAQPGLGMLFAVRSHAAGDVFGGHERE